MAVAQKTEYALRALFELAKRNGNDPVPVSVIAEAQAIPPRFLENVLIQIKAAGIVESVRGRDGGYRLARPPEEITMGQVIRAMEGSVSPVNCLGGRGQENCPMRDRCVFLPTWKRANDSLLAVYDGTSYADLLEEEKAQTQKHVPTFQI